MRAMSNTSSTRLPIVTVRAAIRSRCASFSVSSSVCHSLLSKCARCWMTPSGARRSWAIRPTTSFLIWSTSRSCAVASRSRARTPRSASSLRLRSVRSRVTLAKPRCVPSAPRSDVITTFAQKREPSLRTRHPSVSNRPFSNAADVAARDAVAHDPPACRSARSAGPGSRRRDSPSVVRRRGSSWSPCRPGRAGRSRSRTRCSTSRRNRSSLSRSSSLAPLAFGQVSGHLAEPDQPPVGTTQRGDHDVRPERRAVLAQPPAFVLEVAVGRPRSPVRVRACPSARSSGG